MSDTPRYAWIILRFCVGLPLMASGIFNAVNWGASNEFNAILLGETAAPVLTILGVAQLAGGLSIVTGYQMRFGAVLLLAFLVPATIRHFVAASALSGDDPLTVLAKRGQLSSVEKNVGLIGAMIFLLIHDLRRRRSPER